MILDFAALLGGTKYIYKDGKLYSKYTSYNAQVTNDGNSLQFIAENTHSGNTIDSHLRWGNIILTPYRKAIITINNNSMQDSVTGDGYPHLCVFPVGGHGMWDVPIREVSILRDISKRTYEVDISDLKGVYELEVRFINRYGGEEMNIGEFYLK